MQRPTAVTAGLFEGVKAVARDVAAQNDAGALGADGLMQTGHRLIDLGVKAYAAFLQAAIAGPWWAAPTSGEPEPSDPITVAAQPYARSFAIVEPFVRVGIPRMRIPNQAIRFEPEALPIGATQFRIAVKNYDFIGANYRGKVALRPAGPASGAQAAASIEVIVGL
ncbi:hypothetical protein [Mycolicibacterium moriokaense]|uniref:Uncharacterized protein n=1 Tax=Mycolicibacterium moriokaense TaxID=39691 RepID=A0A318HHJ3_9MYCO|nr:hypothetical protein [Mycolicibacterium moriokaense]PXX06311.1 hypothetical protein C8E89_11484 [Mycolicibacterium moriokaense]